MIFSELSLEGISGNPMAANIPFKQFEIRKTIIKESFEDFQNMSHRLEHVAVVKGIEFINDSIATNVNSTWFALESMANPVIWIAGGQIRGNEMLKLKKLVNKKVKAIVCLGDDNIKIHKAFEENIKNIVDAKTIEEAVEKSFYLGEDGCVVLFSPGCPSFEYFGNYSERGRKFIDAVKDL